MNGLHRNLRELKHLEIPVEPFRDENCTRLLMFLRGTVSAEQLVDAAQRFGFKPLWHQTEPNLAVLTRRSEGVEIGFNNVPRKGGNVEMPHVFVHSAKQRLTAKTRKDIRELFKSLKPKKPYLTIVP